MPSGAPTNAEYLLVSGNPALTQYRTLTASGLLVPTDGGALGNFDIGLDQADLILANLPALDAELQAEYLAISLLTTNGDLLTRAGGTPTRLGIGSTGDVLTVAGGAPTWAAPTPAAAPPFTLPMQSGIYYGPPNTNAGLSTFSMVLNRLYLAPFLVPVSTSFDRAAVSVSAAGSSNFHVGIYGPITGAISGAPLVFDSGQIASTGANNFTATISQTLAAGVYVLAMLTDTTKTMNALLSTSLPNMAGLGATFGGTFSGYHVAQTYGNLPSTVPAGLTLNTTNWPLGALRAA